MTIHYHGVPLSGPNSNRELLAGRCFCVSHAYPAEAEWCHRLGQSVMLDNGAFSAWRVNREPSWGDYYAWAERWLEHRTTWAVIPDVIAAGEEANDVLLTEWPFGDRGAPVWHLHESFDRLLRLADEWPRICIGSSGAYSVVGTSQWHRRMEGAFNRLCGNGPAPTWIHMLRGMAVVDAGYPFASVDSTDVGQNHHRPQNLIDRMADRWDARQAPARWHALGEQVELAAHGLEDVE